MKLAKSPNPAGKRERQRIERSRQILSAALDEFLQRGFHATRVEDIAATVGITKGAIYFHFDTKEELFGSVIRTFAPRLQDLQSRIDKGQSHKVLLESYISILFDAVAVDDSSKKAFHLLVSEGRHFPDLVDELFAEFLSPLMAEIRQLIAEGIQEGAFDEEASKILPEAFLGPALIANIWNGVFGPRRSLDFDALRQSALFMLQTR